MVKKRVVKRNKIKSLDKYRKEYFDKAENYKKKRILKDDSIILIYMPNYKIWYLKKVEAKNTKQALKKEPKAKLSFHSIVEEPEEEINSGASAIGFQYYPEYNEFND